MFIYTKGQTTVDDIIEHILMRLNTDFAGSSLQVPNFCSILRNNYDQIMELKVRDKMFQHGVAAQTEYVNDIMLTSKGVEVFENGGWKKYLEQYETKLKIDSEKVNKSFNPIVINGSVNSSQIGVQSDFGNLESSQNSIVHETPLQMAQPLEVATKISKKENIWTKIYKLTDHKLISMLLYGLIGFLLSRLIAYFEWF